MPIFEVHIHRLSWLPADASVVDPNVYPSKLLDCLIDCGVDGVFFPGVKLEVQNLKTLVVLLQFGGRGFEGRGLDVAEGKLADAVPCESVRGVLANAFDVSVKFRYVSNEAWHLILHQ